MTDAVVGYDQSLPEIPDRRAWEKPNQHLVKEGDSSEWSVKEGRRESRALLVPAIRREVDAWRNGGYAGASEVTRRLFEYWFQEDHDVPGFAGPLRYHFCQREAIETLAWLVEIADSKDAVALVQAYGKPEGDSVAGHLLAGTFDIQTPVTGARRLIRYVPEKEAVREQDLPPKDLRRYAFKMATGSGKTWVMAMAVVWSYFHRWMVEDSEMSSNFLIVSPNVIVHPATGEGLRREQDIQRAAADPSRVARFLLAQSCRARRGHRARPFRQSVSDQHSAALSA